MNDPLWERVALHQLEDNPGPPELVDAVDVVDAFLERSDVVDVGRERVLVKPLQVPRSHPWAEHTTTPTRRVDPNRHLWIAEPLWTKAASVPSRDGPRVSGRSLEGLGTRCEIS